MTSKPITLTAERLRQLLDYDPETGVFHRKIATGNTYIGDIAGGRNAKGYWCICIDYEIHLAHRLAWFHVLGVWPDEQIDHKNGDRLDNRWRNLREATSAENAQNQRRPQIGVYQHKSGRWRAKIKVNGRQYHLGYHDTAEEARYAYLMAKTALHPFWSSTV